MPWLIQLGIDKGIPPLLKGGSGTIRPLVVVVIGVLIATVVAAVTFNAFLLLLGRVGQDVVLDIRRRLFVHFQRLSVAFHERYTSGRVISRQTSDVEAIADLLGDGIINLITSLLLMVGIGIALLLLDLRLALLTLSAFPVLFLITRWFRSRAERAYRATREAVALVIVHFVESLGGIQAVHAFRREPRNQEIFEHLDDRYRAANFWSQQLGAVYGPGVQFVGRIMTALVLGYGSYLVLDGHMTVGVLAAFLLYLRRFFAPMEELSQFYNLFQAAAAALEKLSGVLEEAPSVPEPVSPTRLTAAHGEIGSTACGSRTASARCCTTSISSSPAGQTVALVGATGAGKTDDRPPRGPVLGPDRRHGDARRHRPPRPRRDRPAARSSRSRRRTSSSPGSVADNIRFGKPGASAAETEAAARAIGAHDFIASLPDGYATDVHQKGARLSAGQRQLVAFARAFLADPAVLILDEATSSLDVPSERLVQRALQTLLADRTAIIIAHRLTTVEIADRVVVVDDGRVVEDGAPADLIGGTGRYAALHHAWAESLI